ncbi:hypothetical protein GCM10010399_93380 [Dactylosporangium fulvum]|uniref:Uncharacterized protein n=1 Tax=Dactylosporangium fulvum TaxID=53359 RepID=A0ABY5VV24_9ACTN|nr:hypothetical protein [Dactylosporangium fulvum]UWP81105.1 hypothetical protein Dfulv_39230 [Dactylosporangium fulvum]
MRLWLKVHREVAGAWRSACYDVNRRRMRQLNRAETAEFGPWHHRGLHRPPRRVAAATGVALLVAGGAAGTYLAVAGSLSALTTQPAEPPLAAPASPAAAATAPLAGPAPQLTQPRPQVRRSTPPQVIALPPVQAPSVVPTTKKPESTPTPSESPSASDSASPSPSATIPSPSSPASKPQKSGRYGDENAATGQISAGR